MDSRDALNALFAAGIIFLSIITMRQPLSNLNMLRFEVGKSILATSLWLWLVLDAAFGPWQYRYPNVDKDYIHRQKIARIQRAFLSLILLL
jgi:hypothetical protein